MPIAEKTYFFQAPLRDVVEAHKRVFIDQGITCDIDEDATYQNGGIPCHILRGFEHEQLVRITWAATINIVIDCSANQVRVTYKAENDGWGPIQQRHVDKFIENFHRCSVVVLSKQLYHLASDGLNVTVPQEITNFRSDGDPIEQLKKLSQLKDQGVLTEEEFTVAKKRIIGSL